MAAVRADVFAALGDPTRLALLARLSAGEALSITRLADGTDLTRQAVSKHLKVLADAGVVTPRREGRQVHFMLEKAPLDDAADYLGEIGRQWDGALLRLKAFVDE